MESQLVSDIETVLAIIGGFLGVIATSLGILKTLGLLKKRYLRIALYVAMTTVGFAFLPMLTFLVVPWYDFIKQGDRGCDYVDRTLEKRPGAVNILAIVVEDLSQVPPKRDRPVENEIRDEIASHGRYPQGNFFRDCFFEEGHFLDLYDGRSQMLVDLEIHKLVDYLILAEKKKTFFPTPDAPGLISCRAELRYRIVDGSGISKGSGTPSASGVGIDSTAAEKMANERLADSLAVVLRSL